MLMSFTETAFAQGQNAAKQPSLLEMLIMPAGFLAIFYFFMIRPQAKKARDHQSLVKGLKAGDEVVTTGGIIGRVKSVSDTFVTVDVGSGTLKVVKEHITALTKQPVATANAKQATAKS